MPAVLRTSFGYMYQWPKSQIHLGTEGGATTLPQPPEHPAQPAHELAQPAQPAHEDFEMAQNPDDDDDDLDLDEEDFAESEAKYNRERARLEAKRVDLSAPHLRATTPLQEIVLLSCLNVDHLPQTQPDVQLTEEISTPLLQEQEQEQELGQE